MRLAHFLLVLISSSVAFAAVPAKKTAVPRKTAVATKKPTARTGSKTTARTSPAKKSARVPAVAQRSRQQTPTTDRYREIQQALADKGYLKSEPTGVWGPESIDALRQFQSDKNIQATGKLNSVSLIGLGLGPRTAGPLVMPSATATVGGDAPPQ